MLARADGHLSRSATHARPFRRKLVVHRHVWRNYNNKRASSSSFGDLKEIAEKALEFSRMKEVFLFF